MQMLYQMIFNVQFICISVGGSPYDWSSRSCAVYGCTDVIACNYNDLATDSVDGSCNVPTSCDTCSDDGTVNSEGALDGVCESCSMELS